MHSSRSNERNARLEERTSPTMHVGDGGFWARDASYASQRSNRDVVQQTAVFWRVQVKWLEPKR